MPAKSEDIGAFIVITTALILVLILFIIAILFLYKRKQFMLLHRIELLKNEYEKSLLSSQLEIKEQTLSDISYEIHDNIILLLSVAKLNLNTINWDKVPEMHVKVSDAFEQVQQSIDDLTLLSQTLNSNYITNLGLPGAIELEIKRIERLQLFKTSFEIYGTEVVMDSKKEVIVFRIVQEAIRNSLRHAKANCLSVKVNYTKIHLHIRVDDDGKEWKKKYTDGLEKPTGLGLNNMEHRAKLLNGTCLVAHTPGAGTTVTLIIPLNQPI